MSEFNKPVDADITGIVSGNNSITLPQEVLGDEVTEEPGNVKIIISISFINFSTRLYSSDCLLHISKHVRCVASQ